MFAYCRRRVKEGLMTKLRESLFQAEHHAAEGQALVDEQRHVAELTRQGQEARDAEHLLLQFEAVQALLIADRDRLHALVTNIEADWPQSAA